MTFPSLEKLNKEVRDLYLQWYEYAMRPNLRIVSDRIDLGYSTMKNFKTGSDTTYNNLIRILDFLEEQGFQLKEHA
jgi:hypothetical protein